MQEPTIDSKHYLTCLWPGMPELWWRGRLSALPVAVAFAVVVNVWLIARFLYSDWLSGTIVRLGCWILAGVWICLVVRAIRELPHLLAPRDAGDIPDEFPAAHIAYLQDDLVTAEEAITTCLSIEPRDPPALLMLSAIYRRTGRVESAKLLLKEMRKLEIADRWTVEIDTEEARLERDLESAGEETEEASEPNESNPEPSSSAESDDAANSVNRAETSIATDPSSETEPSSVTGSLSKAGSPSETGSPSEIGASSGAVSKADAA